MSENGVTTYESDMSDVTANEHSIDTEIAADPGNIQADYEVVKTRDPVQVKINMPTDINNETIGVQPDITQEPTSLNTEQPTDDKSEVPTGDKSEVPTDDMSEISTGNDNQQHLVSESVAMDDGDKQVSAETEQTEQHADVVEEAPKEESELDKYWEAVNENPNDFTGWTYLLQYVEQENDVKSAAKAFDAFLAKYPYCYGYWKKYADMYKKHEDLSASEQVYIDGLKAIPLSTDLWLHYINFLRAKEKDEVTYDYMKRVYEDALNVAGTDFRSHRLWDHYVTWETENNNLKQVTAIFDRVICIPLQLYNYHFENFQKHVNANHPKDIVELDEFLALRKEVLAETPVKEPEEVTEKAADTEEDTVPGVDAPPGVEVELAPGIPGKEDESEAVVSDDENKILREKIIEARRKIYSLTEEQVSKRWTYEENIRRPYFHVKPLEKAQLKNWQEYLDFEIENGTHERVLILFERCMIACSLYENMWIKYANYLEPHSIDGVRHVYSRACNIHLTKKAELHLAWAAFEESQGNPDAAIGILENFEQSVPGLMVIRMRHLNLLRRLNRHSEVMELYSKSIEEATDVSTQSCYACRYARFLTKVVKDVASAREVLKSAIEKDRSNAQLHLQLIDLEYHNPSHSESEMLALFDIAINSTDLSLEQRVSFSQRKLEYLDDFGADIKMISTLEEDTLKLKEELKSTEKKRKCEDDPEAKMEKRAKIDSATNGSSSAYKNNSYTQQNYNTGTNNVNNTGNANDQSQNYYNQWPQQQNYQNYNYNTQQQQNWGGYYGGQH